MEKNVKKKKEETAEAKKPSAAIPEVSYDFDLKKFDSTQFKVRTGNVPVPDMKDFFPKGVKPTLLVRGLTALELARTDEEVKLNREAVAEESLSKLGGDAMNALRVLMRSHLEEDTPDQFVKTLHMVRLGLVKPEMTHEQVIKFGNSFPIEFRVAWLKINELTGKGQDYEGKPEDSGPDPESSTR